MSNKVQANNTFGCDEISPIQLYHGFEVGIGSGILKVILLNITIYDVEVFVAIILRITNTRILYVFMREYAFLYYVKAFNLWRTPIR